MAAIAQEAGINANLLFDRRRLYLRSMASTDAQDTCRPMLLPQTPVRAVEPMPTLASAASTSMPAAPCERAPVGTIEINIRGTTVARVRGAVDEASFRAVQRALVDTAESACPPTPARGLWLVVRGQDQCEGSDGGWLAIVNPATGTEIGRVSRASVFDLDHAAAMAQAGFEKWRDTPAIDRSKVMRRAALLLRERVLDIAPMLTLEQGKPIAEARAEILSAAEIIDWFADEGLRVYGRIVPSRSDSAIRQMVLKDPVGPVIAFTPWNFPISQIVRKLAAALSAGCSMIVKASEETPAASAQLMRVFADAGLPPGVLGLVFGEPAEISNHLIAHPLIRKVTFTGSTQVGKQLAALAGRHMKRVTMELGGHAPVIVADDADVALAARASRAAK